MAWTRSFPDQVVCEFTGGGPAEGLVLGGLVFWTVIRMMKRPDQERVVRKSLVMRQLGPGGRSRRGGGV